MITIFKKSSELLHWRASEEQSIGLVPTMGNLHSGHLSLLEASVEKHPVSVITIFVNPKQFGPNEDFERYPRTLEDDINLIEELAQKKPQRKIILFAPESVEEIFPTDFQTSIIVTGVTNKLCGKTRPTHFQGVTTVVYRLFSLINPHTAYFGQKDWQQVVVLKKMATDLRLQVRVKSCPLVRSKSGLALSSRNQYLSSEEKEEALILYRTLKTGLERLQKGDSPEMISQYFETLKSGFEYLEILDAETLEEVHPQTQTIALLGALQMKRARLIDNILFTRKKLND